VPARLQDVVEPDQIALDVRIRVLDAVPDPRLRREVYDDIELVLREESVDEGLVGKVALDELVGVPRGFCGLFLDFAQAVLLERRIVVVVQVVKADDAERLLGIQEPQHEVGAYEAGGAGDEEGLGEVFCWHNYIDKISYSSPVFPSSKDINHPKRPPIQEAPSGQKRYRYAVLPDLFCKDTIKNRIYFLSAFGLTIKKSAHSADFKGSLRLKTAGQANDRLELLRIPPKRLCLRAQFEGLGGCRKRALLFGG